MLLAPVAAAKRKPHGRLIGGVTDSCAKMETKLAGFGQFQERVSSRFSHVSILAGNDSSTCWHFHPVDPQNLWKTL
jgi:hypothetical protein